MQLLSLGWSEFKRENSQESEICQNVLNVVGGPCKKRNLSIWHGVTNNTITPLKQTKPFLVLEINETLLQYKNRIAAFVYNKKI